MKSCLPLTTLLLASLTAGLCAQSADNFKPPAQPVEGKRERSPDDVQMTVIDKEAESELLASPSRYAGLDRENYIQAISSSFSMRTRDIDPFARHQDPNFKPIQPVIAKTKVKKFKKEPITPFSDIIKRISVTAVMPAQQTFLVSSGRSFKIGDRIRLDIGKEKLLSIHVTAINSNSVTFRHGITGESASLRLKLMPDGMSRGKAIHPPGFVPANSDAPLLARPDNPSNPISSRR